MNTTMIRKFCTLQEAAERLNTTEERIENLLRKGILREFRDGDHRLLRTADVGAILAARNRRLERQGQPLRDGVPRSASPRRDSRPMSRPSDGSRLPPSPTAAAQTAGRVGGGPKTTGQVGTHRDADSRVLGHRPPRSARVSARSSDPRPSRGRREPEALPPRPSLSVREWLWMGLTQDRPVAIALLSGLVLVVLAALIAGACLLAGLR